MATGKQVIHPRDPNSSQMNQDHIHGIPALPQDISISHELTGQPKQSTRTAPSTAALTLQVHFQRHLTRLHDGRVLARALGNLALGSLLVEQLARLGHGEADELALALALALAAGLAAAEQLESLHCCCGAHGLGRGLLRRRGVAEELAVGLDGVLRKRPGLAAKRE